MYITHLTTRGFKSRDLDLPLARLSVVIGGNETCKSAVTDALRLLHRGLPPEGALLAQPDTAKGIMRYARTPAEGLSVLARYSTGQEARRRWYMHTATSRDGTVSHSVRQECTQNFQPTTSVQDASRVLAGLLPEPGVWDVRELLGQSADKLRAQLLTLFGHAASLDPRTLLPDTAPKWALPEARRGKVESASVWIQRVAGERDRLRAALLKEQEQNNRTVAQTEADWRPAVTENAAAHEREAELAELLLAHDLRRRLADKVDGLRKAAEAAGPSRPTPPAKEEEATVQRMAAEAEAASAKAAAAAAEAEAMREDLHKLAARTTAAREAWYALKIERPTALCQHCGKPPSAEPPPADLEERIAAAEAAWEDLDAQESELGVAVATMNVAANGYAAESGKLAAVHRRAVGVMQAAHEATRRYEVALATHEARAAGAREALLLAEAELEEAAEASPPAEEEGLRRELAAIRAAAIERGKSIAKHEAYVEARAEQKRVVAELTELATATAWIPAAQRVVMESMLAAIVGPVSAVLGRPVTLSLTSPSGLPECRFLVDGVDAASLSHSAALAFLVGMRHALAPLSSSPLKLVDIDAFEVVSRDRRLGFLERQRRALAEGRITQAIVVGCPDSVPAEILTWDDCVVHNLSEVDS